MKTVRYIFIATAVLLFGGITCGTKGKILSLKDVKENNGKEVTVIGIYRKAIYNQRPENKTFYGHYKIEVNESLSVLLLPPYDPGSKRPPEEAARLEGRKVKVTGVIGDRTYWEKMTSLRQGILILYMPCFYEIKSIELLK